jgi:hypothetical protein
MKSMVAPRSLFACSFVIALSLVGCAPMVEPGADAAPDARADSGTIRDTGVIEDSGIEVDTGVDTGVAEDVSTADAAEDVVTAPEDACVPQCTGRVCGDDRCGGVCGMCGGGASCTAAGTCSLTGMMGGGQWSITAVQGDINARNSSGGEWDVGINMTYRLPDPKVCITVGSGREECSGFINNTIAPSWNFRFPSGVDTAQLTGRMLRVRIADDDTLSDDAICPIAPATVTAAQVMARTFEFRCASGGVEFFLTAR